MMSASEFVPTPLPSGLVLELFPLRMADENRLVQAARSTARMEETLEAVLLNRMGAVIDPGPYSDFVQGASVQWDKLLGGDAFAAMLALRKISYDEGATFTVLGLSCPSGQCPRFDYDIDLDGDIIVRPLDEVGKAAVRTGEPLLCNIDGRTVSFDLSTGASVKRVRKLDQQYPGRVVASRLRSRIRAVEGVEAFDIMDWLDGNDGTSQRYPGLRTSESERLRDALDEHECGVDTEVEISCEHCKRSYMIDLPFDTGFLVPGTAIARRKRDRRRGSMSSAY